MARPDLFPDLPGAENYNGQIIEAHNRIAVSYNAASALLRQETSDHIRLRIHADRLSTRFVPILEALEVELHNGEWVTEAAAALFNLIDELKASSRRIASQYVSLMYSIKE